MNGMFAENMSYLDSAKAAVETFFKWELRRADHSQNSYVLLSYQNSPARCETAHEVLERTRMLRALDQSDPGGTNYFDASGVSTPFRSSQC